MLTSPQRIHLIGIGGIGVSAVARALRALGHQVSGSDRCGSSITAELAREGIPVGLGSDPARVRGVDLVGRSGAVPDTDPEVVAARTAGVPVLHRAALLGAIAALRTPSVGVMGTHGKGTVAAMIATILEHAGCHPSFVIGAQLHDFDRLNARVSESGPLVVEVDESDGSHALVPVDVAVLNTLEADHLNYYASLEAIQTSLCDALASSPRLRRVVVNASCPGARGAVPEQAPATTFALAESPAAAEVVGVPNGRGLELWAAGRSLTRVELQVRGRHNLANAVAAAAVACELDVAPAVIARGLASFTGLVNRMAIADQGPTRIVRDFVSHATGIRAVLEVLADDPRPIVAVFRPYRYTLVRYLGEAYCRAFARAHRVIITDLDPADEEPLPGGSADELAARLAEAGLRVERVAFAGLRPRLGELMGRPLQVVAFGGDDLFDELAAAEAQAS